MLRAFLTTFALIGALIYGPLSGGPPAADAQVADDIVAVSVQPGWQTESGSWMAALHFTLSPGWKTYWRAPGDAGIPPVFHWDGSENVAAISILWPVPQIFDQAGMRSIGYHDTLVLPLEIWPRVDGEVPVLAGSVDMGVCQDICVPVTIDFAAPIAAQGTARNPQIMAALIDQPLDAEEAGVTRVTCQIETAARGMQVTGRITMPALGGAEAVVIETGNPALWVSEARSTREGDVLTAVATVIPPRGSSMLLERSSIRFTVLADGRAVDIRGCQGR